MKEKLRLDGYSEYFAVKNKEGSPYGYTLSLYSGDVYYSVPVDSDLPGYNIWNFNELTIQKSGLFLLKDKNALDWITYALNGPYSGLKIRHQFLSYLCLLRVVEKNHIITSDDIKMFLGLWINLKEAETEIDKFHNNRVKYQSEAALLSPKGDEKFSNAIEKMFKEDLGSITIPIDENEDRNEDILRYEEELNKKC